MLNKICILLFILTAELFSQKIITIYHKPTNDVMAKFENDFMETILNLYNKKNTNDKIEFNHIKVDTYKVLFDKMKDKKRHDICSISSITITMDRMKDYDFSIRYLKDNHVVIRNTKFEKVDIKEAKVGYLKNSLYEDSFLFIKNKYPNIIGIEYDKTKDVIKALETNLIDYQFASGIIAFIRPNREIVEELPLNRSRGYGIIYPKGSALKEKLDPTIKYFLTSPKYFALIAKHFGEELLSYYKTI
jgi:hypothetical protein